MQTTPVLPRPLSLPFSLVPGVVHSHAIARALNLIFASSLKEGEMDFLEGRIVRIEVTDARFSFSLSLHKGALVAGHSSQGNHRQNADLAISGSVYDFLLMISRKEDADTLFFQRRLKMEGDTELGLYVKNYLDGMDVDVLPFYQTGNVFMLKGLKLYEFLFSNRNLEKPI
ncbi:MAG: sterol-binding protein [Gammaproteobacteria bacterium]|nr:MAG: sterol-binding protein [Gammaproteobacteria bacterium]